MLCNETEKRIKKLLENRGKIKLDIGCGKKKASPKHIGIDKSPLPCVDIKLDLEKAILPFNNNSVDEIVASHSLEHISNYLQLVNEMWRTLKPGGNLLVRVPHYKWEGAYTDPTHVRRFTRKSFHFFDKRKVLFNETGWYLSHARFYINEIIETEQEIFYDLSAQKKTILLVAPRNSIHTKRWKTYLSSISHKVNVASRLGKGIADFELGRKGFEKEKQIDKMPEVLEEILSNNNFDVVHAHYATQYGHILKSVPETTRKILSVWGEDVLDDAKNNSKCAKRLMEGLENADYITTTSEQMRLILNENYGVDITKIWVIPWGYTNNFFPMDKVDKTRLRKMGIFQEGKLILSGRVCRPQNNIEKIIDGFNVSSVDGSLVILTGDLSDKGYTKSLQYQNRNNPKIKFLPPLKERELSLLYNKAIVTISIPYVDQLSTTILESLACGTPVICSNIPVYRERIVDGENGLMVNPDNAQEVAKAIKNICCRNNMKEASIKSVENDSWLKNSKDMLKVYDAPK
jgi:glycosyltransferase involved in cell wall biosynthesis